ncbi:MAG: cytidylate kinase-like family protein [Erysipelotrichaceae bacterium]
MNSKIITISRLYGSGGRQIAQALAKRLELPLYDKEIIELASKNSGISYDFFTKDESIHSLFRGLANGIASQTTLEDQVYLAQYEAIQTISNQGPCIILGRGAAIALKDKSNLLNVYIYADIDKRKQRAINEYGNDPYQIEEHIAKIDSQRASYLKFYSSFEARKIDNYHLCIDSGALGIDKAVAIIEAAYEES